MRQILAGSAVTAGIVFGGALTAFAQTPEDQSSAEANARGQAQAEIDLGSGEFATFLEEQQEREQQEFQRFFEREKQERSGQELRELERFRSLLQKSQERERREFLEAMGSESAQADIGAEFARQLMDEFPQVTRGLSEERLVRLSERVCLALQGEGNENRDENRNENRDENRNENRDENADENRDENAGENRNENAAQNSGRSDRSSSEGGQAQAAALVSSALDTGKRTTQQVVEFISEEGCDTGNKTTNGSRNGTSNGSMNDTAGDRSGESDGMVDAASRLSSEFEQATRGLSSERLMTLVDDVSQALQDATRDRPSTRSA